MSVAVAWGFAFGATLTCEGRSAYGWWGMWAVVGVYSLIAVVATAFSVGAASATGADASPKKETP